MATPIVEPTKQQVQLDLTTSANYTSAFDNAAMTPTMLGQVGSIVAQTTSNALATKWGYQEGMNPHGDILPPLTKADQVYQQAYLAQSSNTLSLQANNMMMQANEQLSKAYQLTPSMIDEYQNQMAEGTKQILENAPTQVKATLGYQYASQIQNTTHNLRLKLATQNKQRALDHMNLVDKQTDTDIINKAMSGDVEGARALYEQKKARNLQQYNSGMMSESQAYTSNESAKVSFFTAQSNAKALEARKLGGEALDKYLASLANMDTKPPELSYDQYNTMGNNTLRFMNHLDSLEQNERNDIVSSLNSKLFAGTLNDQDIEEARKSGVLKPSDINTLTAKWNRWQALHAGSQAQLLGTSTGFTDTVSYNEASAKKQNEAFNQLTNSIRQKNPNAEPGTIEAEVASIAGGPNGAFFKQLTGLSRSPIPTELERASRMYHIVNNRSPENLSGLPQEAMDNIRAFDAFRELYPNDLNTAAAMTRNVMMPKTQEQKEANNAAWAEYRNNNLSTSADRLRYAKNVLSANGFFFKPDVLSSTETSTHVSNILQRYMKLFNGDIDAAKNATQSAVGTIYGETHTNGTNEVGKFPIEKYTGFGRKSTFFVQHDAINSLQTQFGAYREAYDSGRSDFYYRVKDADKWSLSGLESKIKQSNELKTQMNSVDMKLEQLNTKRNKAGYFENMKFDKEFENLVKERTQIGEKIKPLQNELAAVNTWQQKVEIEQVWRGQDEKDGRIDTYSLSMNAGDNTSFSYDATQPILGDYDIFLVSPTGARVSIQALGGRSMLPVVYTPDFKAIRNNTSGFINATGGQTSYEEAMKEYKESLKKKNEPKPGISDQVLASRGMTAELARRQFLGGK